MVAVGTNAEPISQPLTPSLLGRGAGTVVGLDGYEALFTNPAGFRSDEGEFTVLSVNPWFPVVPGGAAEAAENTAHTGVSFGMGFVGRNLGLGGVLLSDLTVSGKEDSLVGRSDTVLSFVGGYSYPIRFGGASLHLGGAVRPMMRMHSLLDDGQSRDALQWLQRPWEIFSRVHPGDVYYGVALAFDVGLLFTVGPMTLGVLVSDIGGTRFSYRRSDLESIRTSMLLFRGLPEGIDTDFAETTAMSFGIGFVFEVGERLAIQLEAQHIEEPLSEISALDESIHGGLVFRPREGVRLMCGMAGTRPTVGAAASLGFLDLSLAYIHGPLNADNEGAPLLSVETAVRF